MKIDGLQLIEIFIINSKNSTCWGTNGSKITAYTYMTTSELQALVFVGGSIIIDANQYTPSALQSIVFSAKSHGAKVIIKHASSLTATQCRSIAFSGGGQGNVTFDFTD